MLGSAPLPTITDTADLSSYAIDQFLSSREGIATSATQTLNRARWVTRTLIAIAITQTLAAMAVAGAGDFLAGNPNWKIATASAWFLAVLMWALAGWSKSSPLPPAIAGLSTYLTMQWSTWIYCYASIEREVGEPEAQRRMALTPFSLVKFAIIIALVRAVYLGVKHRRLATQAKAQAAALPLPLLGASFADGIAPVAPGASVPRPRRKIAGIFTGMALFVALLYNCINLTALWGDGELTPHVYVQMVGVMAVLVIVWSVACWRDAYRPLIQPVHPGWYAAAVPLGCISFALAMAWSFVLRRWVNLPDQPIQPNMDETVFSWGTQLMTTAVSPALIEELAFRGIMFPAFARTLKGWETVIVTALMFMVLHVRVPAFPHLLVGGLLLGYMRWKSGTWLPGVFVHFTYNFLCLITGR